MPTIIWLKDGMPVSKRVTVSNADGTSQLLIPSAERSDSGIYTIIVKNIVGQETFSVEIRVTGKRKYQKQNASGLKSNLLTVISHVECVSG